MKICLINAPCLGIDDANLEPPLGLLYIAANLRENGYKDVQIYTMTDAKTEDEIQNKIDKIPFADIYGFTVYCTNYNYVKQCIKEIRYRDMHNKNDSFVVLGGPNASALPEFTFEDTDTDFVVVGEGEDAFLEIVSIIEYHKYEHHDYLSYITYGEPRKNIDTLSMPAWDLVNLNDYSRVLNGDRVISIISSRGCPNSCVHCNSVIMGSGHKIRYRSPENVVKEIQYLQSRGFNSFRFSDDNFTVRPNLREFLSEIKKLNIKYRIFAHIKDLNDENCKLLADSGCIHISIGIESMNPDNLRFLRKNTKIEIIEPHLRNVKRYGMMSRIYFIVGLPYDTNETIEKYFTIVSLLPFDEFSAYPLLPYPGTEIYNNPEKFGYTIIEKDWTKYFQIGENRATCFALNHKNFTHDDVKRWLQFTYNILESRGKIQNSNSKVAK